MWTTISSRMNARASHLLRHRHASDQLGRGRTSQALVVRPAKETHLLGPSLSPKCAVGKVPQLLRLAGPVSLMTFRLRSGTRVDAVTFAAVVPGARRDGGNHHDREQQEPFSINILHVFPFTRFDIWNCLIAQLAGFRLSSQGCHMACGCRPDVLAALRAARRLHLWQAWPALRLRHHAISRAARSGSMPSRAVSRPSAPASPERSSQASNSGARLRPNRSRT